VALEAIEGQPRAVELLRRALAGGRLAHAYAFVGPLSSGRMTTALAFAQALLCPADGCGKCRACALVVARQHPDLHVILPTPPETNPRGARSIRIGAVRELERQAALAPAQARRKVFVLDEAERMTGEAPQAFLKTLEEPPDRTVIMLVLPGVRALPATVLSRCQIVRFQPRLSTEGTDRREAEEALAEVRAQGVDALFRRAQAFDRDRERAERFVDGCWLHLRDLLLVQGGAPAKMVGDPGRAAMLEREATAWTMDELLQGLAVCRDAREALAVNVGPRLTLEVVLSRLALRAA
jgi:DNA polymerase III subunit delta'